ncbi:hypothetical protein [Dechloromonas denitrificans]|uniref:hypothetical protein n=1 Tax=Dechloromonas denitrificans TaxID=281362 RepID=UPI001CFA9613|nr:hypothetical protein [Dechloromonas denitrificans]UCV06785.1 hypothetical protein KI615_15430 [Dechloromonas denitrificans]
MQSVSISKYFFRIRTRSGVVVENLSFFGRDEDDARRKLLQIYNDCQVLDCELRRAALVGRNAHMNYEDVVDLIVAS